ncbi:hypothetical protein LBMAG42_44620 [Deltaproteobacteria bacterium]|nr:hypothetical protein LBMAG42_44620 [Deltaproteobacteria bacterium]
MAALADVRIGAVALAARSVADPRGPDGGLGAGTPGHHLPEAGPAYGVAPLAAANRAGYPPKFSLNNT